MSLLFDPEASKVVNSFGGYDPNEKGTTQYPRRTWDETVGYHQPTSSSQRFEPGEPIYSSKIFDSRVLDPVSRHYRLFVQDPNQIRQDQEEQDVISQISDVKPDPMTCGIAKLEIGDGGITKDFIKKPIDPIHWKSNLFDRHYEKYYLRNNLVGDPYRPFLSTSAKATTPPHYFTEYKESFSGNPTKAVSSSGRILGLSRPTDITETCDWRRNRTEKLRDVVFSPEKQPVHSHLDYNDPKRYNPWPRLKMGYDQMLEGNYRPRPSSSRVEYNVTTLLPALVPHSKQWIV